MATENQQISGIVNIQTEVEGTIGGIAYRFMLIPLSRPSGSLFCAGAMLGSWEIETLLLMLCGMAVLGGHTFDWHVETGPARIVPWRRRLPSFDCTNGTMSFRSNGAVKVEVPPTHFIVRDGAGEGVYRVDVSEDQKILTVTRVLSFDDQSGKQFHTVLILEKQ